MRSRLLLAQLVVAALPVLATGCVSNPTVPQPRPMTLSGTVTGLAHPEAARVDLYRMTEKGVPRRMHGAGVVPAADGSFETTALLPAKYLLALRAEGRPVSVVSVPVPPSPAARLVARDPIGHVGLELRHDVPGVETLRVLLSSVEAGLPVTDRREVEIRAGRATLVPALTPGAWQLDVLGTGATTSVQIPDAGPTQVLMVSPPAVGTAGVLMGRVIRVTGEPAVGVAVSAHSVSAGSTSTAAWGRFAVTDSDGGYRLEGLTAGANLLRVTCRDGVHHRLPAPAMVTIPPSGVVRRSFVVER